MNTLFALLFYISLLAIVVVAALYFIFKRRSQTYKWSFAVALIAAFASFVLYNLTVPEESAEDNKEVAEAVKAANTNSKDTTNSDQSSTPVTKEGDNAPETAVKSISINEEAQLLETIYKVTDSAALEEIAGYKSESGIYYAVTLMVTNTSNESIKVNDSDFSLEIDKAKYKVDPTRTAYHEGGFLLEEINPGLSKTNSIVFEIPKDTVEQPKQLVIKPNRFKDEQIIVELNK